MKIALIIPCTSKNRPWTNIKESYLFNLTFKTFLLTQDKEHEYHFYLGIDNDDTLFNEYGLLNGLIFETLDEIGSLTIFEK
jgi:hypothetical protein